MSGHRSDISVTKKDSSRIDAQDLEAEGSHHVAESSRERKLNEAYLKQDIL